MIKFNYSHCLFVYKQVCQTAMGFLSYACAKSARKIFWICLLSKPNKNSNSLKKVKNTNFPS